MQGTMARLHEGERLSKTRQVQKLLHQHPFGLRESEVSSELGWQRRTANNYLRALKREGLAYKEGLDWFPDE